MRRRGVLLIALLELAGVALAGSVRAAPDAPQRRVGILCPITCKTTAVRSFRAALASLGYREGDDIVFEYRSADGDLKRLPELAGDLVRERVDVVYTTWGTAAGRAAKRASGSLPVVAGSVGDPVAAGLVASLNRPGGNVTAISSLALELEGKRLQFLKQLMPSITRVAVFRDAASPYSRLAIEQQRMAADLLGIELSEIQVGQAADIDRAFAAIENDRLAALCIHAYVPVLAGREQIVELAAKNHVAAIYPLRDFVEAGGLLSYGASLDDNARRAAADVAKILKGATPADLPVEQSTRVELVVNLKTAKTLGLVLPQWLLARADEVIE